VLVTVVLDRRLIRLMRWSGNRRRLIARLGGRNVRGRLDRRRRGRGRRRWCWDVMCSRMVLSPAGDR
jgi:hypothetical protein